MRPRIVLALGIASLVLVFVLPPAGLALAILTLFRGIGAVRATRPQQQELLRPDGTPVVVGVAQPGRGTAVLGLVLGAVATAIGALLLVALVVFWPQLRDYQDCRNATVTTQGANRCEQQLKDAVTHRLGQ